MHLFSAACCGAATFDSITCTAVFISEFPILVLYAPPAGDAAARGGAGAPPAPSPAAAGRAASPSRHVLAIELAPALPDTEIPL